MKTPVPTVNHPTVAIVEVYNAGAVSVSLGREEYPSAYVSYGQRVLRFCSYNALLSYGAAKRPNGWPLLRGAGSVFVTDRSLSFSRSVGIAPDGVLVLDGKRVRGLRVSGA